MQQITAHEPGEEGDLPERSSERMALGRVIRKPHSSLLRKRLNGSQDPQLPAHSSGRDMVGDCNSCTEAPELQIDSHNSPTPSGRSGTVSPEISSPVLRNQFLELTEFVPQPVVPGITDMGLKSISREQTPIKTLQCGEPAFSGKEESTPIQLQKHPWRDTPRDSDNLLQSRKLVEIPPLEWLQLTQPQSSDYLSCTMEEPQPSTVWDTTLEGPHIVGQSSPEENIPLIADPGVSQEENQQPLITGDESKSLRRSVQVNYRPEFDMKVKATVCHGTDTVSRLSVG